MIIYFALVVLSLILPLIFKGRIRITPKKIIDGEQFVLVFMLLLCTLVMGLRDITVGTDTNTYAVIYERIGRYASTAEAIEFESNSKLVYTLLDRFIFFINSSPYFHIFLEAVLINLGVYFFIKKASVNYSFSVFLYFGLTLMYFGMNGTRQSIAMFMSANGVFMLASNWKNIKGWLLIFLATGIHIITVVSFMFLGSVYLCQKVQRKKLLTVVFSLAGAVSSSAIMWLGLLVASFLPHYQIYFGNNSVHQFMGSEGGGRIVFFYIFLATYIVYWLFFPREKGEGKESVLPSFVPAIAFGLALGIVKPNNLEVNRIVMCFTMYFLAFIPYVIQKHSTDKRIVLTFVTVIALLTYSSLFVLGNYGDILPYRFFWE